MTSYRLLGGILLLAATSCSGADTRGIADKRSDFSKFLPMKSDPGRDGLKVVSVEPARIRSAIERACQGGKAGSSVFEERENRGYYVNCNPRNRQLLNGYVPINPKEQPHSR